MRLQRRKREQCSEDSGEEQRRQIVDADGRRRLDEDDDGEEGSLRGRSWRSSEDEREEGGELDSGRRGVRWR
jgi:hypothetical protein